VFNSLLLPRNEGALIEHIARRSSAISSTSSPPPVPSLPYNSQVSTRDVDDWRQEAVSVRRNPSPPVPQKAHLSDRSFVEPERSFHREDEFARKSQYRSGDTSFGPPQQWDRPEHFPLRHDPYGDPYAAYRNPPYAAPVRYPPPTYYERDRYYDAPQSKLHACADRLGLPEIRSWPEIDSNWKKCKMSWRSSSCKLARVHVLHLTT
jgi:hypothetical protein